MFGTRIVPMGYQQITPTTATLLTVPTGATVALFQAEAQSIRFRDDGTAPSATAGMLVEAGLAPFEYSGTLSQVQVIQATSGGILDVSYYRIAG